MAQNALLGPKKNGAMKAKRIAKAADIGAVARKTSLKLKKAMVCLIPMWPRLLEASSRALK